MSFLHPNQVLQWPFNFAPGLKLNSKIATGKYEIKLKFNKIKFTGVS